MTAPTGTNLPVNQYPGIKYNPDGTPVLTGGTSVPSSGAFNLWGLPKDLTDYLNSTSGGKLFFDIGHRSEMEHPDTSNLAGIERASKGELGTVKSTYQILTTPEKVMAQFQGMQYNNPAKFLALQTALAQGSFGKVNINGTFDGSTQTALKTAMLRYIQASMGAGVVPVYTDPKTGKTSGGFVGFLLSTAQTAQANGGAGTSFGSGGLNPINLTDPAQIRQAAIQAAQDALGQSLDEKQLSAFVSKFQNAQMAAQTQIGGAVNSPDLSAEAMSFAQKSNPEAFKQNQRTSYLDALVNLLGGNRPSQTPVPSANGSNQ